MMLTIISNFTLDDVKSSINHLLEKSSQDEKIRELSTAIVANKPDPIAAIFDWVKGNVTYTPDPEGVEGPIELFISPARMVKDFNQGKPLAGDCDDMALLTTALCRSIGIKANIVLLDIKGQGIDHAITQAYSDKLGWINLDPSSEPPLGWELKYYQKVVV